MKKVIYCFIDVKDNCRVNYQEHPYHEDRGNNGFRDKDLYEAYTVYIRDGDSTLVTPVKNASRNDPSLDPSEAEALRVDFEPIEESILRSKLEAYADRKRRRWEQGLIDVF